MHTRLFYLLLAITAVTILYYIRNPLTARVEIRGVTYFVDVAATDKEKELGLGNRRLLPENKGMLFPYDHKETFSFWMKNMRFPIDIIWIRDNQIVDISKNVPVESGQTLPTYQPGEPVNKVLEVNAGESDKHGFAPGDLVQIRN